VLPFWATPPVRGCLAPEVVHPAAFTFKLPDTVSFAEANVFDRAVAMIASGKVDLKPLISATFPFDESVQAFERAAEGRPADVKLQVKL
jgi:D-xylulose reductase